MILISKLCPQANIPMGKCLFDDVQFVFDSFILGGRLVALKISPYFCLSGGTKLLVLFSQNDKNLT